MIQGDECPACGSEDYEGELHFEQFGSGLIKLKVETICDTCGESSVYERGLTRA